MRRMMAAPMQPRQTSKCEDLRQRSRRRLLPGAAARREVRYTCITADALPPVRVTRLFHS
jgi:hypothetical protein